MGGRGEAIYLLPDHIKGNPLPHHETPKGPPFPPWAAFASEGRALSYMWVSCYMAFVHSSRQVSFHPRSGTGYTRPKALRPWRSPRPSTWPGSTTKPVRRPCARCHCQPWKRQNHGNAERGDPTKQEDGSHDLPRHKHLDQSNSIGHVERGVCEQRVQLRRSVHRVGCVRGFLRGAQGGGASGREEIEGKERGKRETRISRVFQSGHGGDGRSCQQRRATSSDGQSSGCCCISP